MLPQGSSDEFALYTIFTESGPFELYRYELLDGIRGIRRYDQGGFGDEGIHFALMIPAGGIVGRRFRVRIHDGFDFADAATGTISNGPMFLSDFGTIAFDDEPNCARITVPTEETIPLTDWFELPPVPANPVIEDFSDWSWVGSGSINQNHGGFYEWQVWIDDAPVVVYNCECEDDYPRATLAQLRRRLAIRLGFSAMWPNLPPGYADLLNDFLISTQEVLYRDYAVFRTERFFTWNMVAGVRFYDLDDNADSCPKKLDPRKVTWVGVSQGDDLWTPLGCGIDPTLYSTRIGGTPDRYEIRQCIEVWPAPFDNSYKLRIKGYFGLLPFAVDADYTTIDSEVVFLFALALAKAHYRQPDANIYADLVREMKGDLRAGSHHTRRYLPGSRAPGNRPMPRLKGEE